MAGRNGRTAFEKLPRVVFIELAAYLSLLGLGLWLLSIVADIIDSAKQISSSNALGAAEVELLRSGVGLSISFFVVLFSILGLLVWVLSRYVVWRAITEKRLDSHHIMENLLLGVPFNLIQFAAMSLVLYIGYLIIRPFLMLPSIAIVVAIGELVMLFVCAPLLFNILGFSTVAYYWYFMHDDLHYFGWFALPFRKALGMGNYKYKHTNPDLRRWEKAVLLLAGIFVVLDIVLIFVHLLPPYLNWGLMLLLHVMFVSWGKLYMVDRVFG